MHVRARDDSKVFYKHFKKKFKQKLEFLNLTQVKINQLFS